MPSIISIRHIANIGFTIDYSGGCISQATGYYYMGGCGNYIDFYFTSGKTVRTYIPQPLMLEPFHEQFGIVLSYDCRTMFIPDWTHGFFSIDIASGRVNWAAKLKRAYKLFYTKEKMLCYCLDDGIYQISNVDGSIIQRYAFSTGGDCFFLSDNLILLGPKRGAYYLIDNQFNVIDKIPIRIINPNQCSSIIIQEAYCDDRFIFISGIEQVDNKQDGTDKETCFLRSIYHIEHRIEVPNQ